MKTDQNNLLNINSKHNIKLMLFFIFIEVDYFKQQVRNGNTNLLSVDAFSKLHMNHCAR